MRVAVIRIGNSKGIRLSKRLLEKYKIKDEVDLILGPESILLKPIIKPRKEWDKSFEKIKKKGSDSLLIDSVLDPEDWG